MLSGTDVLILVAIVLAIPVVFALVWTGFIGLFYYCVYRWLRGK